MKIRHRARNSVFDWKHLCVRSITDSFGDRSRCSSHCLLNKSKTDNEQTECSLTGHWSNAKWTFKSARVFEHDKWIYLKFNLISYFLWIFENFSWRKISLCVYWHWIIVWLCIKLKAAKWCLNVNQNLNGFQTQFMIQIRKNSSVTKTNNRNGKVAWN